MYYWITRENKKISLCDMETSHIVNAINMRMKQLRFLELDISDKCQDFEDDFGQDFEVATAINLCGDEFQERDRFQDDLKNLMAELSTRGVQIKNGK